MSWRMRCRAALRFSSKRWWSSGKSSFVSVSITDTMRVSSPSRSTVPIAQLIAYWEPSLPSLATT